MSEDDFIDKLIQLFNVPENKPKLKRRVKLRVCFILGHWLEKYFETKEDNSLFDKVNNFIQNTIKVDPIVKNETVINILVSILEIKVRK